MRKTSTLKAIEGSLLDHVAGGQRLLTRPTEDGVAFHVLTPDAEAEYKRCSDAADQSWFRPFKQFGCNRALKQSIEDNKIGEVKLRR